MPDFPTFHINILNEGVEGTVIVVEYINDAETVEVLHQMMTQNQTITDVVCQGTGLKKFHWKNIGSGNEGDAEKGDGLTLHVY